MGRSKALIEKALRIDGLSYYARVTTYTDPTHFKADDLAGIGGGDDFFKNWFVYVARDAGGAGAAPQDELAKISDYTYTDGTFTHVAFTTPLAVDDGVLIVHKSVAAAIAGGVDTGGISIWDSFEYPSDASLNAKWTGTSVTLTRSLTAFYEHYSMQAVVAGAGGEAHRNFAVPQDIGALRNISVVARCNNAGDTFQFTLYDSSGNYSFWTQTLTLANTWYTFDIDPHSTPTGDGGTPVDLDDVVQIRFAALTDTTTYLFDMIMLESLMSSIIGLGYDGLDDAVEETSSVRGHLLLINDNLADAGITAYPAVADIGNGVTVAAAVRAILHSLVGGDNYDNYTNISNSANASINAIMQKFAALWGADVANTFGPTIQGSARSTLEAALDAIATYFTASGAAMAIQIQNGSSRSDLEHVLEDYFTVVGCDGTNLFNPTIQGSARTTFDTALAQLATYFSASGAAMALQVNNQTARTNLEQALNDFFAVVGCDGTNIFNPTIDGSARTTLDAALQALWDGINASQKGTPASGAIDNLNVNTEVDLVPEVTQTTVAEIDAFFVDYTGWLADVNIVGFAPTLTIRVYLDDDGGTLREVGNLRDVITESVSVGSVVKIDGLGTFERNFKVTVQSSIAPAGGAASNLVKYHYVKYDRE